MKIKILSILFIFTVLFCIAQDVLLLPFDATSLTEEQKVLNPDYRAYPTALEDSMPTIICNDELPDCMDAVDLGLSVKWANRNVGAGTPEDYGDYFAWGEVVPKEIYNWSTYLHCDGTEVTITKYNTSSSYGTVDNKTELKAEDDAASVNWGGAWRMPTDEEMTELRENCIWIWTSQNEVNGYKITGPNGNSIFLPAGGCYNENKFLLAGTLGDYWCSSLYEENPNSAYNLDFASNRVEKDTDPRNYGRTIRPVSP